MCKHELYHFQACNHFGIEIHEVCSGALFTSGLKGYLPICKPDKIFRHFTGDEIHLTVTVLWHDIDGACRECVEKHHMDDTIYQTDEVHRSIHPAAIKASHPPLDPLARGPYVFVPRIAGSVFRLIGAGQIARDHWWAEGPTIVFPQTVLRPTWGQLRGQPGAAAAADKLEVRGQWKASGTEVDAEELDDLHGLLGISEKGMTRQDITDIMAEIQFNQGLESLGAKWAQMWASSFAGRGMPSELFNETVEELMVRAGIDGEEED